MTDSFGSFRTELLATLGGAPATIEPGRLHRFSTSERRGDSAGWCKLFDDLRGGVYGCHRQFPGESFTWSAIDRRTMTLEQRSLLARQFEAATAEREAQQRLQWFENAQRIAQMWAQCVPISPDDPCSAYLTQRGLVGAWPLPEVLRFHPSLPYWNGLEKLGTFPAMVAPLIAPNGSTVALHRTYLTSDGRKANVPTPKKVTGASGLMAGASIPLHEPTGGVIGIAEGIETALATHFASGIHTVAAYCAGNMASYVWPPSVKRIVVFADADRAGVDAAQKLKIRAMQSGLSAVVLSPTTPGTDWCDVWMQRDTLTEEMSE
jgi:phage/plasmid primase-like uncharacterized protein